jgi:hypothetical protein
VRTVPGPGPYFGAWVGMGGPLGGLQTDGYGDPQFGQGFGFLGTAGYAFIPNFGVGAFIHYNATEVLIPDSALDELDENSGSVLLYGLEARGILGSGPLAAWASLGLSLGSGSLDQKMSRSDSFSTDETTDDATLDWKVMPVVAFGAEVEVARGLYLGPHVRWYITSADKACSKVRSEYTDPDFSDTYSNKRCTTDFGEVTVPDILFLGIGATYRIDLTR